MSAFEGACLGRKHRLTRPLALATLLAAMPGPAFLAQIDLADVVEPLGAWKDRPEYSLTLRECLTLAMDHNLDIAVQDFEREISGAGVDTARSRYDSVLTSNFTERETNSQNANPFFGLPEFFVKSRTFDSTWNDPTIWGGNFTVFFQGQKQIATEGAFSLIPADQTALNFTYRQSLLRSFGLEVNRAPIVIAQNSTRISEAEFRDTVMSVLEATESAYWELVFARRDLEVKRQSLDLAQELLEINRAKVEVGTLAPIDVTQAEAGVASRMEDLVISVGNLLNAEDSLRQLLNPPRDHPIWGSTLIPSDQPSFTLMTPDEQEAIEIARKNRPELEQQRISIENNSLQEKIDRKAKRWDLFVEGRYDLEGLEGRLSTPVDLDGDGVPDTRVTVLDTDFQDALRGLDETSFADWTVQAGLTIPIGNRQAKARYATSRLRHEQSQVQLENLLLAAEIDVRQKVRDVTVNIQRVRAAQANRELQDKNVAAEKKKYDNGMSTSFQVLQVQEDLSNAESQENRAKVDFQKSLTALERAKGTLLQTRNIQIARLQEPRGGTFGGAAAGSLGRGR